MRARLALVSVVAALGVLVPLAQGSSRGTGTRELRTQSLVSEISADGAHVAVDVYTGTDCDVISVWSPLTGARRGIERSPFCADGAISGLATLAGTRLLWQDGESANSYTDYTVYTVDTRRRARPAALYAYEYTHDDYGNQYYGPRAGPFAGHGSLLVFATVVEHVSGTDTNARLWRVDGRRRTLIRRGIDFTSLSVNGGRVAGAVADGPVLLLGADGHTIRALHPALRLVRVVVLQDHDLAAAGGGKVVVLDTNTGRVKGSRNLPPESRLEDYANGLAALIHGNSIHVFRISDGKDVVVARPHGPGIFSAYIDAQIEPAGLFYTYTTETSCCQTGHVVFVPWKTLEQELR